MHVRNLGYPFSLKIGDPKNHLFGRLRNLTAIVTAYRPIFGTKLAVRSRTSALKVTKGLLRRLKTSRPNFAKLSIVNRANNVQKSNSV